VLICSARKVLLPGCRLSQTNTAKVQIDGRDASSPPVAGGGSGGGGFCYPCSGRRDILAPRSPPPVGCLSMATKARGQRRQDPRAAAAAVTGSPHNSWGACRRYQSRNRALRYGIDLVSPQLHTFQSQIISTLSFFSPFSLREKKFLSVVSVHILHARTNSLLLLIAT
jgi:hypothetical protein